MTISEAIKHCKEVAEENESKADRIEQLHLSGNAEGCRECASDHQQLAEWLKELKALREVCTSKAFDMAIEALGQEPCEDAISRQAVLDGLASIAKAKAKSDAQKSLMGRVMFFTEHLPSVTPNPKTDVLDKIRAKIQYAQTYKMFEGEDTVYVKRDYVLTIIDKYKAGSEE